jgi:tetratricopeptide (TPR) repeat protein
MKRILYTTIFLLSSLVVFGQGAKVNTAYANFTHATDELRNNNLEKAIESLNEAVENIEPAILDPKTSVKSKTWRYRGNIYSMIAGIETMREAYPDAVILAMESYDKALELDTKGSYSKEVMAALVTLHDVEFIQGNTLFGEEKYEEAIQSYDNSIAIFEVMGLVDSVSYFNGALAADNGKIYDKAIENYTYNAQNGYQAIYCYNRAVTLLKDQEKYMEALELAKEGRLAFPDDNDLLTTQLNVYLAADMYEEAELEMEIAANEEPDDPTLWFALGVVKDNLGKVDEAEAGYLRSLEVDPLYFNSNMNLAILYFQKASKMIEVANEIPAKEVDKYNVAKDEALVELAKAVPYFEAAYEIRPNRNILMDLKEAYVQLGDTDNYNRVKAILDSE